MVDSDGQVRRLLIRIEENIEAMACISSSDAENAAMMLCFIFDNERSCISRLSCSARWACICSTCSEKFAGRCHRLVCKLMLLGM
jgi:hypothetical protein